jgi:hypothetical protein
MIPVLTIITLIEVVTALVSVTGKTIIAVDKLKNGKPEEVDVEALKKALLELPDLTALFPSEEETDTPQKDRNPEE